MAASDVLPPENPMPDLLRHVGFRRRRTGYGSATQLLWNKLESYETIARLCQASGGLTMEDRAVLEQCKQKLELARRCLDKPFGRWSFSFWEVIHEVDGLLLLVMPRHMLLPKALEIQQQFQRRVLDPVQCKLWLGADRTCGPLPKCVNRLVRMDSLASDPAAYLPLDEEQLAYCRHVLRGALDIVNEQVDKTFWQLSINVSIQILSTVLLLALFVIAFWRFPAMLVSGWPEGLVPLGLLLLSLAGAAGAILSNMLSRERFVVATGATSRYFAYHLLVKPVVGAFAALMLVFLERSQMLLAVVIRPEGEVSASSGAAPQPPWAPPDSANPFTQPPWAPPANAGAAPASPEAPEDNLAIVHINVPGREAAFFTMAALAVVAGYSADKLLGSIMDRMLGKLLGQSEKVLPPSNPAATEAPAQRTASR